MFKRRPSDPATRQLPSWLGLLFLALTVAAGFASPGVAQGTDDPERVALLQEGLDVYTTSCQSCHQAGGIGIGGTYPPLVDNPRGDDLEYLVETITNGRQGALEVEGLTYEGVMPSFSTLSDDEVEAVATLIQADFEVPAVAAADTGPDLPLGTGTLPRLSGLAALGALLLAALVGLYVMRLRIAGQIDRLSLPWLDAWLRSLSIVVLMVVAVAVVPSLVLKTGTVAKLDRPIRDVVGLILWSGGLGVGLFGLWYLHRDRRI